MRSGSTVPLHVVEGKRSTLTKPRALVADRMTRPGITIGWAEPMWAAVSVMSEHGIRHLPVVETDGRLIGILTESDVREALASEGVEDARDASPTLIVGKAMSGEPISVPPDTRLTAAVQLMADRNLSALPVVDRDHVVGIITETEIAQTVDAAG
jgi:acetoin utilization protein AcuB